MDVHGTELKAGDVVTAILCDSRWIDLTHPVTIAFHGDRYDRALRFRTLRITRQTARPSSPNRSDDEAGNPGVSAPVEPPEQQSPAPPGGSLPYPWDTDDTDLEDRWYDALNPAQAARVRAMFDRRTGGGR